MRRRILLLGASGLLGEEVIRSRKRDDVKILGLYNKHPIDNDLLEKCDTKRIDLLNYDDLEYSVSDFNPEIIINCAAHIFKSRSLDVWLNASDINVRFNFTLLRLARKYSVEKIINCSSASVYSLGNRLHIEDDIPEPVDYYGLTKLMGEEILKLGSGEIGIQMVNLRLCGLYGIKRKGGAVYNFLYSALRKNPLHVPKTQRLFQFLPVIEAAQAIWLSIFNEVDGFVTYNIGLEKPITLLHLANEIKRLVPDTKIITTDGVIEQMPLINIHKARSELRWTPQPLSVGIENFYKQLLEIDS